MQCPGGLCLPADRVCDGRRDCPSGIDEALCPTRGTQSIKERRGEERRGRENGRGEEERGEEKREEEKGGG